MVVQEDQQKLKEDRPPIKKEGKLPRQGGSTEAGKVAGTGSYSEGGTEYARTSPSDVKAYGSDSGLPLDFHNAAENASEGSDSDGYGRNDDSEDYNRQNRDLLQEQRRKALEGETND